LAVDLTLNELKVKLSLNPSTIRRGFSSLCVGAWTNVHSTESAGVKVIEVQALLIGLALLVGIYLGVSFVTRTLERERSHGRRRDRDLDAQLETMRELLGVFEKQRRNGRGKKRRKFL
jgi:hypothetical protein